MCNSEADSMELAILFSFIVTPFIVYYGKENAEKNAAYFKNIKELKANVIQHKITASETITASDFLKLLNILDLGDKQKFIDLTENNALNAIQDGISVEHLSQVYDQDKDHSAYIEFIKSYDEEASLLVENS